MDSQHNTIEHVRIDGVSVVRLKPQGVIHNSEDLFFHQQLTEILATYQEPVIVLNLSAVLFLPSAAIGHLISLVNRIQTAEGDCVFCCVQPAVMEVFKIMRIDQDVDIVATEEEAIALIQDSGEE